MKRRHDPADGPERPDAIGEVAMETSATEPQKQPVTAAASTLVEAVSAPALKILLIAILFLLMLIPLSLVSSLIAERQERQNQVLADFTTSWGPSQTVLGPLLVVPYRDAPDQPQRYLHLAPSDLQAKVRLLPEIRKRGLFRAVVYSAKVDLSGSFQIPDAAKLKTFSPALRWQDAFIALRANDMRALASSSQLSWDGRALPWSDCAENAGANCDNDRFVVARLALDGPPASDAPIAFATSLDLRGTEAFWLAPLGKDVEMTASGLWDSPSFVGSMLPSASRVGADGFSADWHVSSNVATGRWLWPSSLVIDTEATFRGSSRAEYRIGVQLLEPVPTYQMVERSAKYAPLFLALSFLTYFLFEAIAGVRIHLIQYGLLGLSLSLFALLLISLSEPLGFTAGYALSALMVLLQASTYTASVSRAVRPAAIFAAVLAALFGFLYVVLSLEAYALLVGALALFTVLSITMAVTRHVDWWKARLVRPV
jgi:inner membrane protein